MSGNPRIQEREMSERSVEAEEECSHIQIGPMTAKDVLTVLHKIATPLFVGEIPRQWESGKSSLDTITAISCESVRFAQYLRVQASDEELDALREKFNSALEDWFRLLFRLSPWQRAVLKQTQGEICSYVLQSASKGMKSTDLVHIYGMGEMSSSSLLKVVETEWRPLSSAIRLHIWDDIPDLEELSRLHGELSLQQIANPCFIIWFTLNARMLAQPDFEEYLESLFIFCQLRNIWIHFDGPVLQFLLLTSLPEVFRRIRLITSTKKGRASLAVSLPRSCCLAQNANILVHFNQYSPDMPPPSILETIPLLSVMQGLGVREIRSVFDRAIAELRSLRKHLGSPSEFSITLVPSCSKKECLYAEFNVNGNHKRTVQLFERFRKHFHVAAFALVENSNIIVSASDFIVHSGKIDGYIHGLRSCLAGLERETRCVELLQKYFDSSEMKAFCEHTIVEEMSAFEFCFCPIRDSVYKTSYHKEICSLNEEICEHLQEMDVKCVAFHFNPEACRIRIHFNDCGEDGMDEWPDELLFHLANELEGRKSYELEIEKSIRESIKAAEKRIEEEKSRRYYENRDYLRDVPVVGSVVRMFWGNAGGGVGDGKDEKRRPGYRGMHYRLEDREMIVTDAAVDLTPVSSARHVSRKPESDGEEHKDEGIFDGTMKEEAESKGVVDDGNDDDEENEKVDGNDADVEEDQASAGNDEEQAKESSEDSKEEVEED